MTIAHPDPDAVRKLMADPGFQASAAEALESAASEYVGALTDASGIFTGHWVTDACHELGGCGPDCMVWAEEATDARGPN